MYEEEAELIRRMMKRGARIIYSNHAKRERMPERHITDNDVCTVLAHCNITECRQTREGNVFAAEGLDLDDRLLRIPVVVHEQRNVIIVVTATEL
jgi:hypothetical protein